MLVVASSVDILGLEVETLEEPLHVSSPLGTRVRIDQIPSTSPWRAPVLFTRKMSKFEWNDLCEKAFQELKRRLTPAPIMIVSKRG